MLKRSLLICILAILSMMLVGCSADIPASQESLDDAMLRSAVSDLDLDNVFGVWYLNYRGKLFELGERDIEDFGYDISEASNKNSGNTYFLVRLYDDNTYYAISHSYYTSDIVKLNDNQIDVIKEMDFKWLECSFDKGGVK